LRIEIIPDTLASRIYGISETREFFGCNYELNPRYLDKLLDKGLIVCGRGENGAVRIVELKGHRFFLATAFQPHMLSKAENPNVLLLAYLKSAM
jgi:CTP synthase